MKQFRYLYTWSVIRDVGGALSAKLSARRLTDLEQNLLFGMAEEPTEPLNLAGINYRSTSYTQLELLQVTYQLRRKGLVHINPYNENLVSLTEGGRKRALELQYQGKTKKNAT